MTGESKKTPRFSTSWKQNELDEIMTFVSSTGIDRNELVRRATLAHIRVKQGKADNYQKAFEEAGALHDKGEK